MKLRDRHKKYLRALGITTLAFMLSQVLLSPLTFSAATMISSPDRSDFTINDFYSHVADKRAVRTLDPDIVMIDIGELDRDGIADAIEMVSLCAPKAVGVDILFGEPKEDDSRIINALRGCPNLVMAVDNTEEVINFCSRTYNIFKPEEIPDNVEEITGKIVLIGSLSFKEDMHTTPVKAAMTGVQIHAHTLSTILSEQYFYKVGKWWNWAIAFISCFMVIAFSMFIPVKIKSMAMRLFQLLLLYVTIRYGYELFINYNLIINFSYSLLMITFGLLANDFWVGVEGTAVWIRGKLTKTYKLILTTTR